ncbi:brachyurin-like isoform X2 [Neocloeon triangulifer]|nr:brachyurin-like isoform X2 [Neocloeon triangulifer]
MFRSRVLAIQRNARIKTKFNRPSLGRYQKGKNTTPANAGQLNDQEIPTEDLVLGGNEAIPMQIPWQVLIYVDFMWMCGGTLISEKWVLTAGHCCYGASNFIVDAGGINRLNLNETGENVQTPSRAIVHPNYNHDTLQNDIALIFCDVDFVFTKYRNAVLLPKLKEVLQVGDNVMVSGYGLTSINGSVSPYLMYVTLKVIKNSDCAKVFGASNIFPSMFCTAAHNTKAICGGDSGEAAVKMGTDKLYRVYGVVSFGAVTCANYPNGYTRVRSYLRFISNSTNIKVT